MEQIQQWVLDNSGVIASHIFNFIIALVIFLVGKAVAKLISKAILKAFSKRNVDKAVGSFISSIVYAIVLAAAVLMALSQMGIQTTSFVAILGAAGLAVGLALQGSLSNFASGVLIILLRPFKAGDYVEAGGVAGSVRAIEIFSTTLVTPDNKVVIVPNSAITGGSITNYSAEATRRVDMVFGVSYKADLKLAKQILNDVVKADERVLAEPAPTIAVSALAESSVNFVVRPWVKSTDYWAVYFDLNEKIKMAFDQAGVEIPFPQMDVHLHKVEE